MLDLWRILLTLLLIFPFLSAQETHSHSVPEKLGKVSFPISCNPAVQEQFDRGVALLHSFTYTAAENAFQGVAERDPRCAMAHWGMAMSYFRQLWDPPLVPATIAIGQKEIQRAQQLAAGSERERQFIHALALIYQDSATVPYRTRALKYEHAMEYLAAENRKDVEAQVFYALALLANASPADKTHAKQKQAANLLEPLYRTYPQHPGIPHYLIHAYDNAELAPKGLSAARAYSQIAPSAPHALHMPSHIFTRLGLWDDSIASNQAARAAAHKQGDLGEELHAMDYLTYAYLQRGRYAEAEQVVADLRSMKDLPAPQFKVGYAATAMPVRLAIERRNWDSAASLEPLPQSAPHVAALVYWARALGQARARHSQSADADIGKLQACLSELKSGGNLYWATQVDVLIKEAQAWRSATDGDAEAAVLTLRAAADEEDAVEKLPVTPGPIVHAREQLGELLLDLQRPDQALREFQTDLTFAPGRRGAIVGAITAAERLGDTKTATQLRAELTQ